MLISIVKDLGHILATNGAENLNILQYSELIQENLITTAFNPIQRECGKS